MRDLKTAVFLVDLVRCHNSFWQTVSSFGVEDLDEKKESICPAFPKKKG